MEPIRAFVPRICCDHRWDAARRLCLACGATCSRDRRGRIEEYEFVAPAAPAPRRGKRT